MAEMPTTPAGISSWIEFSSGSDAGRDFMVIETPIGAGIDPANLWTPDALTAFAWHVVRWCEQPLLQSGGRREGWFRRSRSYRIHRAGIWGLPGEGKGPCSETDDVRLPRRRPP